MTTLLFLMVCTLCWRLKQTCLVLLMVFTAHLNADPMEWTILNPCCMILTHGLSVRACAESIAACLASLMLSFAMVVRSSSAWVMAVSRNNSSLLFNFWRTACLCWHIKARCWCLFFFCCCFLVNEWSVLLLVEVWCPWWWAHWLVLVYCSCP